jgi:hypothetical protein
LLSQEQNWNYLAQSYQFVESVDRFLHGSAEAADGWQPIAIAPFERQLEIAVDDGGASHAVVFPVCRVADGWIEARTGRHIDIAPTHWREWIELDPRHGQPRADAGPDAGAAGGHELVIFENEEASLRVARGENDLFELVVNVHGEELTAYDLDGDRLATIGRRLLTLARRA